MIPGVRAVHRRESWADPRYPVTGPPAVESLIDTAVIHYTAAAKIPGDVFNYHRSMQRDYVDNRGYSLGYRWSVVSGGSRDGEVFQIRGWDLKSAANAGHNEHTEPILVLVDGNDAASNLAVASVRAIIAESQRRVGRTFKIVGHGQLSGAATSCPGIGLRAQITAGLFSPAVIPPKPPTDKGHSVFQHLIRLEGKPAVYAQYSGGYKTWVPDEATRDQLMWLHNTTVEVIPAKSVALFRAAGPIVGPVPAGVDAWGV